MADHVVANLEVPELGTMLNRESNDNLQQDAHRTSAMQNVDDSEVVQSTSWAEDYAQLLPIEEAVAGSAKSRIPSPDRTMTNLDKCAANSLRLLMSTGRPFQLTYSVFAFLARTIAMTVLLVLAYVVACAVLTPELFANESIFRNLIRDVVWALAIVLLTQFIVTVRTIVGGRVLTNIVLGRYHCPLSEHRLFMFLDVVGSTALTEKLGPNGAYSIVSRFFLDVAHETKRFGGETHAYVGDKVIVSWPYERGLENACCLRCYFAIRNRIESSATRYEKDFGVIPNFYAGLHGGPVIAGECGGDKREIVYFGDAINTAARIEHACRELNHQLLISGDLLRHMELPAQCVQTDLGSIKLRGREKVIELFTVNQHPSD